MRKVGDAGQKNFGPPPPLPTYPPGGSLERAASTNIRDHKKSLETPMFLYIILS
jgi:hypothetical protein